MHLLIGGFASIGHLMVRIPHGEAGLRDCHLSLSLSAVCDCGIY